MNLKKTLVVTLEIPITYPSTGDKKLDRISANTIQEDIIFELKNAVNYINYVELNDTFDAFYNKLAKESGVTDDSVLYNDKIIKIVNKIFGNSLAKIAKVIVRTVKFK